MRKLYRRREGRIIGGVASGLAAHLGLPVLWVRAAFVVLTLGQGLGLLLYAVFWFVVPMGRAGGGDPAVWQQGGVGPYSLEKPPRGLGRVRQGLQQLFRGDPASADERERAPLLALIALAAGGLVLLDTIGGGSQSPYVWPVLIAGAGVAVVWRQADDTRWARWLSSASPAAAPPRCGWRPAWCWSLRAWWGSWWCPARWATSPRCSRRCWRSWPASCCWPAPTCCACGRT
ncbi:PspC domain-containing protein [Streptacidiphilus monticola]